MANQCDCLTLGIDIDQPAATVAAFLAVPENYPRWASGLGELSQRSDGSWQTLTPEGPMQVRFTPANPYGIADHYVQPPGSEEIYIPMRVIANAGGATLLFTLLRYPGVDDARFAADADWVRRDLASLKALLEQQ
ncbi:SRPBCC family protein [Cupriavidus sp. 2TAF22]|uniref:SRPBCC family protein n=1 Tax=unclassified Cupriavidus TaxID=2640874 RepID=UPI003F906AD3